MTIEFFEVSENLQFICQSIFVLSKEMGCLHQSDQICIQTLTLESNILNIEILEIKALILQDKFIFSSFSS